MLRSFALAALLLIPTSLALHAADEAPAVKLAEGKIVLKSPAAWKKVQPKSNIIEYEFSAPAAEGDPADGRITIMGAGGGIQANVDRWLGQFNPPAEKTIKDVSSVKEIKVAGAPVHMVDVAGTFKDTPGGPFAGGKTVLRENYRLLGAIIVTDHGQYFVKFYGPKKTVDANEKAFGEMVNSLEVKK